MEVKYNERFLKAMETFKNSKKFGWATVEKPTEDHSNISMEEKLLIFRKMYYRKMIIDASIILIIILSLILGFSSIYLYVGIELTLFLYVVFGLFSAFGFTCYIIEGFNFWLKYLFIFKNVKYKGIIFLYKVDSSVRNVYVYNSYGKMYSNRITPSSVEIKKTTFDNLINYTYERYIEKCNSKNIKINING